MTDSDAGLDPLESLVEEFASRYRSGESPSVADYAAKHPQYAARIEELFPVVAMMEQLRWEERSRRGAAAQRGALSQPPEQIGDFHILREVGRGGMGIVYEAEQRSLGRFVAVKVLPRHALLLDKHLQRFQREARTAARLQHTNIVPVFGVGEQEGLHYYVMPLVRGVGLDEIILHLQAQGEGSQPAAAARGGTPFVAPDLSALVRTLTQGKFASGPPTGLPSEEPPAGGQPGQPSDRERSQRRRSNRGRLKYWHVVARLGMQAAEALAYAHAQGTLHRDIKPGNLLLDEDGVLCVADFGLARAMDGPELACSGDFVGTARYMAPEQLRGTADVRSDVYALGLTLYELLTLRPAFDRPEQGIAFNAGQVRAEPLRPRKIQRAIPRDLETIVLKCLAFEPAKRYATAAALGADLRRFLEDKPIHARRASWLERAARWCRRNPALATVSALAILLLVAVAVTALAGYRQTSKAYAATRVALQQAEATSQLSLKVLNGIYAQLSPQRIWIASDSDPAGQTCACIGLGTGDGSATSVERTALQLWALPETAVLLENLLAFYDILAAQGGDDRCLVLQSAAATRRVGDIRLCLGQIYRAEQEYQRAAEKLTALRTQIPADIEVSTELAHCQNEIGNVCSARREADRAYAAHQAALGILQSCPPVPQPSAEYRYELARTLYFLASKSRSVPDAPSGREVAGKARRSTAFVRQSKEYRNSAIGILEELARQDPHAPDYRLLLALCYRGIGTTPDSAANVWNAQGRQRAIEILEALTAEYPGVADYRYELIATYAWIPVSLFPWQGHSALSEEGEQSLRKGIEQSEWLVAHNPTVPHYARSQALVLAKLATTCWRKGRLAEADDLFRKALQTQSTLAAKFPELSPHDEVLLQFLRLRLAQVCQERNAAAPVSGGLDESRSLLEQCIEQLTQLLKRPELAADQLAVSSLPLAYDAQSDVLAKSGDPQAAQEAKQKAKAARAGPLSLRERGRGEGVGKADRQSNMSFGERPSP